MASADMLHLVKAGQAGNSPPDASAVPVHWYGAGVASVAGA
jgi:hypothetical protein